MGLFNLFSSQKEASKQPQNREAQPVSAMFTELNQTQKFAMVTMLASLAAAPANEEKTAMAQKMMITDAAMLGLSEDILYDYMQTHSRPTPQALISILRTITDTHIIEWLIYSGFGIIAVNQNEKACYVFYDWWQQLGYKPDDVDSIVKKVNVICNEIRRIG